MSSRLHSLTVVVQKPLQNRAREQAEEYANFGNLVLAVAGQDTMES